MISIVILGSAHSGKKVLLNALAGKEFTDKKHVSIKCFEQSSCILTLKGASYQPNILALSAESKFEAIKKAASLGLYCVDLSGATLTEEIITAAKVDFDKNSQSGSAFILVGAVWRNHQKC